MLITLNGTNQFWLYLHDKGEEYFLHYDYWPSVPFTHNSKDEELWVDIVVKKEVESKHERCNAGSYYYFGELF